MSTLIEKGKMEYDERDVGVNLLESITLGLYRFPLNAIREYIQNAIDSRPKPERIEVRVSGRDIFIIDDGSGMDWNDVLEAKKVGISPKEPETYAGFRGIGVFSGIAVCREVVIDTRKRRSGERIVLRMSADGLRKEILNRSNSPLLQALEEHISFERHQVVATDKPHGTTVHLREVLPEHSDLVDESKMREYLELTAPADFSPDFSYGSQTNQFLDGHVPEYRNYRITLNGAEIRRRPSLAKDKLNEPRLYVFRGGKGARAVWWVCTSRHKQIAESQNRNFVYKCKGLTVGGRDALSSLIETNKYLLEWMVGEIHVIDPSIRPNTERTAFESSKSRDDLEGWLRERWSLEVKEIPRQISAEIAAKKRLERARELIDLPFQSLDTDEKWIDYLRDIKDLSEDLLRDSKDRYLPNTLKTAAKERSQKLLWHRTKAQKFYDTWKTSQLVLTHPELATVAVAKSEDTDSDVPQSILTPVGTETDLEFAPDNQLLTRIEPIVQGLISRLELGREEERIVNAAVRALASRREASEDFLRGFLVRLEYFLKET